MSKLKLSGVLVFLLIGAMFAGIPVAAKSNVLRVYTYEDNNGPGVGQSLIVDEICINTECAHNTNYHAFTLEKDSYQAIAKKVGYGDAVKGPIYLSGDQTIYLELSKTPNRAPVINSFSPTSDLNARNSITFNWQTSDLDEDKVTVTLYYDSTPFAEGSEDSSATWDTTKIANANYDITIKAVDEHGAKTSKTYGPFVVNNQNGGPSNNAPIVSITAPQTNEEIKGDYEIKYIATDADNDDLTIDILYTANGTQWNYLLDDGQNSGKYTWDTTQVADGSDYQIRIRAEDGKTLTAATSGTFTIDNSDDIKNRILDENIRIKADFDDEVKPGEEVEFEVEAENRIPKVDGEDVPAEDVTIKVVIEDVEVDDDKEDLEEESDDFDLDEYSEENTEEITIEIPQKTEDGKYDVKVYALWEKDGELYYNVIEDKIEVERNEHDIAILDFFLEDSSVRAGETAKVGIDILNIGKNDEDVKIEIKSSDLKISKSTGTFELDENDESTQFMTVEIPEDAESGKYFISAIVRYGKHSTTENIIIEVTESDRITDEVFTVQYPTIAQTSNGRYLTVGLGSAVLIMLIVIVILGREFLPERAVYAAKRGRK